MAGWGAMMGLGQSLQQVGGMVLDYNKDKMRSKLEQEREQRAEQRQLAKEAREQAQYAKTDMEQDGEGVWWEVDRSKSNEVIDRRLAPKSKVDEINRSRQVEDLQLEVLGYDRDTKKATSGIAGELAGLTLEEKRAAIDARRASAESSRASAANSRSAAAARTSGAGSKAAADARSAGLDRSTIEALFAQRDGSGRVVTDDEGNVQVNYGKLEEYIMSPEYQAAKDKTAGAARFMARREPEVREERTSAGANAGLQAGELESFIKTGSAGLKSEADLDEAGKEQLASIQESERAAVRLIDEGKLTVEQAAQRMEAQGWKRAAARLRARYGN